MLGGTIAGGLVLLVYVATIVASLFARRRAPGGGGSRAWLGIALVLAALALDKALHLESVLRIRVERLAIAGGWFASRSGPQLRAIAALAGAGFCAMALAGWLLRRSGGVTILAASVAALLLAFVLIRAVSLHRIDHLLGAGVGPLRLSNVIELVALAIIACCAIMTSRARRRIRRG